MTRLRLALAVSLIFNLFLAGALLAGFTTLRAGKSMINAASLRVAGTELPKAERQPFRRALRHARWTMQPTIQTSRQAKAEAAELLRQPVVDQAAVNAALERARTADLAVRAAVENSAVGFAATLAPTDRAKLADALERRSAARARD